MGALLDIVEQHYRDMNDGQWERTAELFRDDVVSELPGGPPMHGIEAFLGYGRIFATAFPDIHMQVRSAVESGDHIVVEGTFAGTHTGPLATPDGNEIPPTGKRVEFAFADAFDVEDGNITAHRVYFDQMTLMAQLGLLPQPA
jgi:predicted ester cyclase